MAEAGTIDSLQIEIEASSKSAVTQINNIAKALKNLKTATNGGLNIGNFKKELGKLGGNEYTKIERLANALQGLKNIKLDDKIGNNMLKIADACDLIEQQHIDKLSKFGNALQTIKSVSTKGYDKLPASILNIAAAVDSITYESISKISQLTIALSRLRGVDLRGLGTVLAAQNAANRANRANIGKQSINKSGQNSANGGTDDSALADRVKQASKLPSALSTLGSESFSFLAKGLKMISSAALTTAKTLGGYLLSALKSTISEAKRFGKAIVSLPFGHLGTNIKNLTSKLNNLVANFKRILFYRAIRTIIKELGDAMREGEENAYWYSKTIGDATHYISEAYDTFASASAVMKNQVGAAWATLFANIEPIITKIVELVTRAAEVVTMFFAKLGGKNTYLKAIDYGKEWAETTEQGSEAAKEWRNQLMGFDEINRLEAPTDSNSGKNKDKTPDYGAMFEEVEVDSAIGDLAERIKELWNNQDWKGLGELIGNTLNDLFPSREKWQEWGAYVGNGIDGVIQTMYYALKTIDFHEWGSRIADGLNSAIDEIDFDIAGRLFTRKFTALLDFVIGFLGSLDWHDVGKAIGDFFRGALDEGTSWLNEYEFGEIAKQFWGSIKEAIVGFDIASFATSLGNFVITAMNSVADFVSATPWDEVVNTVLSSIETFARDVSQDGRLFEAFNNLKESLIRAFEIAISTFVSWIDSKDWNDIGSSFMSALTRLLEDLGSIASAIPWTTLANALIGFISGALDSFTAWLEGKDFTDLGEKFNTKITTAFENIKVEELVASLSNTITTLVTKLGEFIYGADVGDLAAKLGSFLGRAIESVDTAKLLSSLTYMLTTALLDVPSIILGILEGEFHALAGFMRNLGWDRVAEFVEGMAGNTEKLRQEYRQGFVEPTAQNIKELFQEKFPEVGATGVEIIANEMETTVNSSHLSGQFHSMGESMTDSVGAGIDSKLPLIHSRVKEAVSETSATVELELGKVADISEREWQKYSYAADSNLQLVTSTADTNTSQLAQTMETNLNGIQQSASTSFNGVKDAITSATGDIKNEGTSDTQTLYNDVTGIYNQLHQEAVRVFSDIARAVPQIMNYLAQEVENSVRQMEQSFSNMQYTVSGSFDTIRANIESAIYAIESIDWSIPAPHLPHITWYYDTVYSDDGSSFNIPQFNVEWYAKGGVLDKATLFGMGDAGAEALVPLERNTEWIGKVAAEMNRQSEIQDGRDESNDDVIDALYTVCDRIIRAMPDDSGDMDMDSFARAITKIQRRQARAMG